MLQIFGRQCTRTKRKYLVYAFSFLSFFGVSYCSKLDVRVNTLIAYTSRFMSNHRVHRNTILFMYVSLLLCITLLPKFDVRVDSACYQPDSVRRVRPATVIGIIIIHVQRRLCLSNSQASRRLLFYYLIPSMLRKWNAERFTGKKGYYVLWFQAFVVRIEQIFIRTPDLKIQRVLTFSF